MYMGGRIRRELGIDLDLEAVATNVWGAAGGGSAAAIAEAEASALDDDVLDVLGVVRFDDKDEGGAAGGEEQGSRRGQKVGGAPSQSQSTPLLPRRATAAAGAGVGKAQATSADVREVDLLSPLQLGNLRAAFAIMDKDHDGLVGVLDLQYHFQARGVYLSPREAHALVEAVAVRAKGYYEHGSVFANASSSAAAADGAKRGARGGGGTPSRPADDGDGDGGSDGSNGDKSTDDSWDDCGDGGDDADGDPSPRTASSSDMGAPWTRVSGGSGRSSSSQATPAVATPRAKRSGRTHTSRTQLMDEVWFVDAIGFDLCEFVAYLQWRAAEEDTLRDEVRFGRLPLSLAELYATRPRRILMGGGRTGSSSERTIHRT